MYGRRPDSLHLIMKSTKKLTIAAITVALGTVIMSAGVMLEVVDLTMSAVASLLVVLIYIEMGSPYTWLVWIATSLTTAIMFFGSAVWVEYLLVFGSYPLIKAYIERLPRLLWLPIKLLYVNAVVLVLLFVVEGLLGIPVFEEGVGKWWKVALVVLANVAFVAYDLFITVMVRVYIFKWRKHFARFFK